MKLTAALANEYNTLFESCVIVPARKADVAALTLKIEANKSRYELVAKTTGVPWYVIGVIHSLEASLNFNCHLHNGDPLSHRTVHVPAGRPITGTPPFTWEFSAIDALVFDNMNGVGNWVNVAHTLYMIEGFNGFGYRIKHPEVLSPYLWSFSNHYSKGKFTSDGKFDYGAISQQCGAATILHLMDYTGVIQIPR